jgi:disease resistance protein RPS2
VSTAAPQAEVLRQDVPDDIVGSAIGSAQVKLQTWLTEPAHNQSRVIGIYGMGGVGKTSVLKAIHDNYKKVSGIFDIVIWFTVSKYKPEEEDDKIKELQASIAYTLNVDLKDCPTLDIRKMKLSASLEKKRFLLILDDLWSKMDLNKVGVKFGRDKGSKVLISSRSRDVIKTMGASDYSLRMEPLSQRMGGSYLAEKLLQIGLFQEKDIQTIAEEIAKECKGLPLALNVVAAALSSERDLNKWRDALAFMRNVDPSFPDTHSTIDAELYQRLRWSYNDLSDTLKSCFLYCAAFPEDAEIDVQTLVEMWSAEGLVIRRGITYLMDVGRQYIDALVGRCLIEYVGVKKIMIRLGKIGWVDRVEKEVIKVHDVLRDTAIYIGERDEHWVFASGQHLQNFPREEVTRNCKRLSVGHNDIEELPTDLECTELLSLILANCPKLRKVPAASFLNIMSLKVLDLSCTLITSLPTSVGQLGQLEFLNLTGCYLLNELPETICSLFRLQFLNLDFCESLVSLPDNIGDLKSLKHFSFELVGDTRSVVIPRSIFGLTSLTKLCLPRRRPGCAISMEDLINLSNLMELSIAVKAHTMSNCDWTWLKMRKLVLRFEYDANARRDAAAKADSNVAVDDGDNVVVKDADGDEDDVVEDAVMLDTLPLENMNELQSLSLIHYRGLSLPNYICKFQNLEELKLGIVLN